MLQFSIKKLYDRVCKFREIIFMRPQQAFYIHEFPYLKGGDRSSSPERFTLNNQESVNQCPFQ